VFRRAGRKRGSLSTLTYHLKNSWLQAHAVAGCQQGGKRA
jgi:hypothetical protein